MNLAGDGIDLDSTGITGLVNLTVQNSTMDVDGHGITVGGGVVVDNVTITGNTITAGLNGLNFVGATAANTVGGTIDDNEINAGATGINIDHQTIALLLNITNNQIHGDDFGVVIQHLQNGAINLSGNTITSA